MAEQKNKTIKGNQLSLDEYVKIKEKRAKSKLQLHFPLIIKLGIALPFLWAVGMLVYYLVYLRHLPPH